MIAILTASSTPPRLQTRRLSGTLPHRDCLSVMGRDDHRSSRYAAASPPSGPSYVDSGEIGAASSRDAHARLRATRRITCIARPGEGWSCPHTPRPFPFPSARPAPRGFSGDGWLRERSHAGPWAHELSVSPSRDPSPVLCAASLPPLWSGTMPRWRATGARRDRSYVMVSPKRQGRWTPPASRADGV